MAANMTQRKGRGRTITREEELVFLDWLARTGSGEQAAVMAGVSWGAMRQKKSTNKRFRAQWEVAAGSAHEAMVEDFFMRLEESADARSSYLAAGLTSGWYYSRMLRDGSFKARVERTCGIKPNALKKKVIKLAEGSDNIADLLKVIDRLQGNLQPTPPKGG